MSDDIVERLRSLSILDGWLPMMEEAAVEIDRQRKVISAMIEDCQYLKDKQIEAADEIEKLRAALKPITDIKAFTCIYEWTPVEALRDDEKVHVKLTGAQIKAMRAAAALKETGDE